MTITSISTASVQENLASYLQAESNSVTQLTEQLASGIQHSDLTDYDPSDALNLMNLQAGATQKQAYLSNISTVQARLSGYDTTMTDMESIIAQVQTLTTSSQTYNPATATSIASTATNYLKSVSVDLNQQINGRYIYGGSNYTTAPVQDLSVLPASTLSSAIYTDGSTLPSYATGASAGSITTTITGQNVSLGGSTTAGQSASVTVNGKTYSYAVQSTDTTTTVAAALANLVNADIPGTTSSGNVLTVGGTGAVSSASSNNTSVSANAIDSATIDAGDSVAYGVTSNNPAFQELITGLRLVQAAGNTTDSDTYKSDISQATTFLTSALSSLQAVHTAVAGNINLLTSEATTQNAAITNLTNQVGDIQAVDITQVSTEITALTTQLQASYSVTGTIERMSLAEYL